MSDTAKQAYQPRPYYYAWGVDKRMYAYTIEEWGMGGSLPNGGNYTIRSWVVQLIIAIIMIPAEPHHADLRRNQPELDRHDLRSGLYTAVRCRAVRRVQGNHG